MIGLAARLCSVNQGFSAFRAFAHLPVCSNVPTVILRNYKSMQSNHNILQLVANYLNFRSNICVSKNAIPNGIHFQYIPLFSRPTHH